MRRIKHAKTALATPSVAFTDWNDWLIDEQGTDIDLDQLGYNVKAYGAVGDGVTDDTDAIEAASLAASAVNGTIYLPPGTYIVDWRENPNFSGYWAAVNIRSGCSLRGAGIGATTIKLVAGAASHASAVIVSNFDLDGGDERITIADLTIDGNGANQTTLYSGVSLTRVYGARHAHVQVLNVRGTAAFPPGETLGMTCLQSSDIIYTDCEVVGTAGTHGSGFASNQCTNVIRANCIAHGMSAGMGFADWTSRGVLMVNCIAQQNGTNGFNIEVCEDVTLSSCRSGGRASSGAANYPHAADANLGNAASGFTVNASTNVLITGCLSSYNANNGADFVNGSEASVVNSIMENNTGVGVFYDDTSLPLCYLATSVKFTGNSFDGTFGTTIGSVVATHVLAAPAIPAADAPYTNPYPFEIVVYLAGGTWNYLLIDGGQPGVTSGMVHLKSGSTIQLGYSAAPTWTWWRQ